jgi:hypothetical protein
MQYEAIPCKARGKSSSTPPPDTAKLAGKCVARENDSVARLHYSNRRTPRSGHPRHMHARYIHLDLSRKENS